MFREDKATQMAARFLQLAGGRLPYSRLMKLLFLADKRMLLRWGKPIVYDRWITLKYGPALRGVYGLIRRGDSTYWSRHIKPEGCDATLQCDPGSDDLSPAEDRIIDEAFAQCGNLDEWDAADAAGAPAEWEETGETPKELTYQATLEAEGLPADVIRDILDNIGAHSALDLALGKP